MQRTDLRRAFPLALIAIATTAAASGCGSSGATPATTKAATTDAAVTNVAATPAPSPPREFVSHRYGFRLKIGRGWSATDARVAWNGQTLQGLDSEQFANFNDPTGQRTLVAAAARVPKGMRLAAWRAAMVLGAPSVMTESRSAVRNTLGGAPALSWTSIGDGAHVRKLAALHGSRGYMIFLASPAERPDAEDRRVFEGILKSFRFTR